MSTRSNRSNRSPRRNPDGVQAGKSLGAALGAAAVLAVGARKFAGMKKDDGTLRYTERTQLMVVGGVALVAGLAAASAKHPLGPVVGTAILGAGAALVGPPAYALLTAPATPPPANTYTPPAGEQSVAVGQPRLLLNGQRVLDANNQPLLRTAGLFGLPSADVPRSRHGGY